MIDVVMAVPDERPQRSVLGMRKSPAGKKTKRMKQFSNASGHTVLSNGSSEFFGSNNNDNGSNTLPVLKSCIKNKEEKSNKNAPKKQVSFDSIEEREHAIILGDNPSVSSGPPLTIAWESHASYCASVEEYEKARPTRRSKNHLVIPRHVREEWLRHAGYSRSQFAETERSVQKVKRQRATSAQTPSFISKVFSKSKGVR